MDATLSCDQLQCPQLACLFGFDPSGNKIKLCSKHTPSSDQMPVTFDISAYHFIQTENDGFLYEKRCEQLREGKARLSALETQCDSDLAAAQTYLQAVRQSIMSTVDRSLQEILLKTEQRCAELKAEIERKRTDLERLIQEKEINSFNFDCEKWTTGALFRVIIGDCRVAVAEVIISRCYILPVEAELEAAAQNSTTSVIAFMKEQAAQGKGDVADLAWQFASELNLLEPEPSVQSAVRASKKRILKQIQRILPSTVTEEEVREAVQLHIDAGMRASAEGDYQQAIAEFQPAQEQLDSLRLCNPELCLYLGVAISRYADRRAEAEAVLRKGLDYQQANDMASELTLRLANSLMETYHQSGLWEETITLCEWILQTWENSPHLCEVLRTKWFLADTHCLLGFIKEGAGPISVWIMGLSTEGSLSDWMWRYVMTERSRREEMSLGNDEGRAVEVRQDSYLAASARHWRGFTHMNQLRLAEAIEDLQAANHIYSTHFPQSVEYATSLVDLSSASLLFHPDQAEGYLQQAREIYRAHFPNSFYHGICLSNLGAMEAMRGKKEEAVILLAEARQIYVESGSREGQVQAEQEMLALRS